MTTIATYIASNTQTTVKTLKNYIHKGNTVFTVDLHHNGRHISNEILSDVKDALGEAKRLVKLYEDNTTLAIVKPIEDHIHQGDTAFTVDLHHEGQHVSNEIFGRVEHALREANRLVKLYAA